MATSLKSKNPTDAFIEETFATLENKLLSGFEGKELADKAAMLRLHKKAIIDHAFFILGFKQKQTLSEDQRDNLAELFETRLLHLFGGLPSFFTNGDELEVPTEEELADLSAEQQLKLKNKLTARNYLRLFMRGTKAGEDNAWFWESPLATKELYETIFSKGDPGLLLEVRGQIQEYLTNAYAYIKAANKSVEVEEKAIPAKSGINKDQEELFRIQLQPLLLSMAFFDYTNGAEVKTPVKVRLDENREEWRLMTYKVKKIDHSPRREDG